MDWTDLMIRLQAADFDRFMTRNFPQSQNDEKTTHWITENVQIPPPQNWNNILVQMSLDARNYMLTYADVISRMTLSVLLCYKLLALGSHKHIHYSCTSMLHVSSTTELEHGGPKCLQALCTLGDWVRRTPRTQNIAQRVPIAQTTWQYLAVTSWHNKASPPDRVFTLVSWFLSIWTTLLITLSVSVVAEASLIFSEPKEITYDAPLCALCVYYNNNHKQIKLHSVGRVLYNNRILIIQFGPIWSHDGTGTLSSRPEKCMLRPWVPWHSRQQKTASANKAPDVCAITNLAGITQIPSQSFTLRNT